MRSMAPTSHSSLYESYHTMLKVRSGDLSHLVQVRSKCMKYGQKNSDT